MEEILREADLARERGEFESAAELYERVLSTCPGSLAASAGLGMALHKMGRPSEAAPHLFRAAEDGWGDPSVYISLGQCCVRLGNAEAAIGAFRRAIELEPDSGRGRLLLGHALTIQRRFEDAEAIVREAIERSPDSYGAHDLLAFVLPKLGRLEEAKAHARIAFQLDPSSALYGFRFAYAGRVEEADREVLDRLDRLEKSASTPENDQIRLQFALGKAREDLGEYPASAAHYVKANALALVEMTRNGRRFAPEVHRREVDYILEGFPSPDYFPVSFQGSSSELPVFIVGMMRSGTTLLEQILSSHPQIGGAGELSYWIETAPEAHHNLLKGVNSEYPRRIAQQYIELLESRCPAKERVCDKLPQNYMNLGTIHAILPGARIILCRRDVRDVCLSLFTTPFGIPPPFAYSAENIASAYRQYQRLVRHWKAVIPPERFLEVDYEELVTQKEETARKMIAFIGLDWNDACLHPESNTRVVETPSQWEVRQPIYGSSIGRWRRFAEWMNPQFEIWSALES